MEKWINKLKIIWGEPSKGFGDTFAKITKSLGFTPCDNCEKRRKTWNEKLAYAKKQQKKKNEEK